MKKVILLMLLACSYVLCMGQATSLIVDNKVAGTLSERILYDDKVSVENLKILGKINADDFTFIEKLTSEYSLRGHIDLSECEIVAGGTYITGDNTRLQTQENTLTVNMIHTYKQIRKLTVPESITAMGDVKTSASNGSAGWVDHHYYLNVDSLIVNAPIGVQCIGKPRYVKLGEGVKGIYLYSPYLYLPSYGDRYDEGGKFTKTDSLELHLPSTIKYIAQDPNAGTPYFTIYSKIEDPSVIEDHKDGSMFKYGIVYAPSDRKKLYENSIFKQLQIVSPVSVKGISLSQDSLNIHIGTTFGLNAEIMPQDATNQVVSWASTNDDIVSVDQDGMVRANQCGEATITVASVENPMIQKQCRVRVYQSVTGIVLNETSLRLIPNETIKLVATVTPNDATNQNIIWNSNNEGIVSVNKDGYVTANKVGSGIIITATTVDGGHTAECAVTVIQPVESVSVSSKQLSLMVGESQIISATVYPANADNKTVSWSSSNEEVATVTNDGKVTAIGTGNAKLYVKSNYNNNIKDSCDITVLQPVTGVNIDSKEIELIVDESIKLNAQVLPNNASNKAVNWTSSDISVAMISPDGTVYGIKPGQATIMATTVVSGFVALCKVTVKSKIITISSISLSEGSATLAIGEALQLNAIISPANATTQIIKWSSINPNIASVDANGLVKAITEGTTQVIATTTDGSNLSAICEITVKKQFVSISSIQIVPNSFEMTVGQNGLLEVEITPTDATNKSVTWSSTNPSVVTVTQDGAVQAHSEGKVVIIASTKDGSNLSAICSVSVKSESGVETITIDNDTQVKIYSLSGVLLYEGLFSSCRLKPDLYIIIHNGCSYKIKITQ